MALLLVTAAAMPLCCCQWGFFFTARSGTVLSWIYSISAGAHCTTALHRALPSSAELQLVWPNPTRTGIARAGPLHLLLHPAHVRPFGFKVNVLCSRSWPPEWGMQMLSLAGGWCSSLLLFAGHAPWAAHIAGARTATSAQHAGAACPSRSLSSPCMHSSSFLFSSKSLH